MHIFRWQFTQKYLIQIFNNYVKQLFTSKIQSSFFDKNNRQKQWFCHKNGLF